MGKMVVRMYTPGEITETGIDVLPESQCGFRELR